MRKTSDDIIIFLLVTTAIILVMAGFVITVVLLYRKKQISHQKNIDYIKAEYEKAILNTQLEIQEQTFKNISKEIHDNIGMSLTLAKLNLNTLKPDEIRSSSVQVNSSIDLISKAITDLTDISKSMNADFIAEYGLINALEQEINKLKIIGLYHITFEVSGETTFMNSPKELIIFRIVQEALNNILKHAQAKRIILKLDYQPDHLDLDINDNGIGFMINSNANLTDKKNGSGLINMKNRALMLGGSWKIDSSDEGTIIKLTVPY
jgi:two-component system, NarL family, sensor kinase